MLYWHILIPRVFLSLFSLVRCSQITSGFTTLWGMVDCGDAVGLVVVGYVRRRSIKAWRACNLMVYSVICYKDSMRMLIYVCVCIFTICVVFVDACGTLFTLFVCACGCMLFTMCVSVTCVCVCVSDAMWRLPAPGSEWCC